MRHALLLSLGFALLCPDLDGQRRRRDRDGGRAPATLEHFDFKVGKLRSDCLRAGSCDYGLYLPKGYAAAVKQGRRLPYVIWLHGMRGSYRRFHSNGARILDALRGAGKIPEMVVVTPSLGGRPTYFDGLRGENQEKVVIQDLRKHLEKTLQVSTERSGRAIMGVSMGAFGAMRFALRHPEIFAAVAVHSSPVLPARPSGMTERHRRYAQWFGLDEVMGDPIDEDRWQAEIPTAILARKSGKDLENLAIYFDAGTKDRYGFAMPNKQLSDMLRKKGIEHTFRLIQGGGHSWGSNAIQKAMQVSLPFVGKVLRAEPGRNKSALPPAEREQDKDSGYREPAAVLKRCIDAPPRPSLSLSPRKDLVLLSYREAMPSIETQARPILRLAGRRIDPATRGPQRGARVHRLALRDIKTKAVREVAVPPRADLGNVSWSADGRHVAFTNTRDDGISLWVLDVASAKARRVGRFDLVGTYGSPLQWMPDQDSLLCALAVPGAAPPRPRAPAGPNIQEVRGKVGRVRTYQDLLQNQYDEQLFDHYFRSQAAVVQLDGSVKKLGKPGIQSVSPSPDGAHFLVQRIVRPYSYLVSAWSFPRQMEVWDQQGRQIAKVGGVGLADAVPIGGVSEGPRSLRWLPTEAATLCWVEALDGGDPRKQVAHRDQIYLWSAPFAEAGRKAWRRTEMRFSGLSVGPKGHLHLIYERSRWERKYRYTLAKGRDEEPRLMFQGSTQDSYNSPGRPQTERNDQGRSVLKLLAGKLLFSGRGASAKGDHPFVDAVDPESFARSRIYQCADGRYETLVGFLDDAGQRRLVRREDRSTPPSYWLVDAEAGTEQPWLKIEDPVHELVQGIKMQRLEYARADGIQLSAKLYLPPDHKPGTRLPMLLWAYPREYNSGKNAGQVRGSFHRYTRPSATSPTLLVLQGYAVMDAGMPVVGPIRTANDTFVQQLVSGAKAAIEAAAGTGAVDPTRVAIAGHSYGAFMTANLLAHSDLFKAGIARSGAYNRTLTPFGFQNERRTYWQAPEVYQAMSPFMHAPKIDEPILLIHGEVDNNSGTFPIQSKRLFHAIKGHGGIARLVMLPHESHGYRARESVLHCVAEMVDWLDAHVKNARAAEAGSRK